MADWIFFFLIFPLQTFFFGKIDSFWHFFDFCFHSHFPKKHIFLLIFNYSPNESWSLMQFVALTSVLGSKYKELFAIIFKYNREKFILGLLNRSKIIKTLLLLRIKYKKKTKKKRITLWQWLAWPADLNKWLH